MGPKSDEKPLGENLPQMANVHILPSVPYHEYITYISSFDLCILPNRVSAHTEGNDPIKIYDYLATGNPVVTTPTAGTKEFSQFLYIAQDKHEFLHLLDKAIREESEEIRTKRKNLVEEHSWQKRICEIHKVIMPYLENYSGIK
jgi:glycosyltransferase involved in cell wall biosynthesis